MSAAHAQDKVKIGLITDINELVRRRGRQERRCRHSDGHRRPLAARCWASPSSCSRLTTRTKVRHRRQQGIASDRQSRARTMLFMGNPARPLADGQDRRGEEVAYFNSGAGPRRDQRNAPLWRPCTTPRRHTVALAKGTGGAVVKQAARTVLHGRLRLRPSAAGRHDKVATAAGGKVGRRQTPLNASDPPSFRCRRRTQGADPGWRMPGRHHQRHQGGQGIRHQQAVRRWLGQGWCSLTDIHSLGLRNTEGLLLTTSWDQPWNDQTRGSALCSSPRPSACPLTSMRPTTGHHELSQGRAGRGHHRR